MPVKKTSIPSKASKKTAGKKSTATKAKSTVKKVAAVKKPAAKKTPVTSAKKAPAKKAAVPKKITATKKSTPKKETVKKSKAITTKKITVKASPKKVVTAKVKAPSAQSVTQSSTAVMGTDISIAPYKIKKGEDYMNDAQRQHFIQLLNLWKSTLMQEVDRTVTHMKDEAANFPDPTDRASQEEEFSLELRTRDRERKLIRKIEKTLGNIKEDDFGYCEACGIEIGIRRLEARPTATLCIDCKTLSEIKERQTTG